ARCRRPRRRRHRAPRRGAARWRGGLPSTARLLADAGPGAPPPGGDVRRIRRSREPERLRLAPHASVGSPGVAPTASGESAGTAAPLEPFAPEVVACALPRDSSRIVVVSDGRLDTVIVSFGCT